MPNLPHVALLIETSREYGRGLLRGVTRYVHEHGPWSIYFKPQGLDAAPPAWLKNWQGDGILARIGSRKMANAILKTGLPTIDLRGSIADLNFPPFGPDNQAVARMAHAHLTDQGFRTFGIYGEPRGIHRYDDDRFNFFRRTVKEEGFKCYAYEHHDRKLKSIGWERTQQRLARWLSKLPKPIGIMAINDNCGQQVLEACQRVGILVPDEVAVISVDNDIYSCGLSVPPLSSIDVNAEHIGYEAAATLQQMMSSGVTEYQQAFFPPRGVVARQSTDVLMIDDEHVATAVRHIRNHACDGITVAEVLARIPISGSMLNRRFRKALGRSPKEEMTRVRLELAKDLLVDSDLSIAGISERCGYNEPKYFIQVFHRQTGTTPAVFRRHARGKS